MRPGERGGRERESDGRARTEEEKEGWLSPLPTTPPPSPINAPPPPPSLQLAPKAGRHLLSLYTPHNGARAACERRGLSVHKNPRFREEKAKHFPTQNLAREKWIFRRRDPRHNPRPPKNLMFPHAWIRACMQDCRRRRRHRRSRPAEGRSTFTHDRPSDRPTPPPPPLSLPREDGRRRRK